MINWRLWKMPTPKKTNDKIDVVITMEFDSAGCDVSTAAERFITMRNLDSDLKNYVFSNIRYKFSFNGFIVDIDPSDRASDIVQKYYENLRIR